MNDGDPAGWVLVALVAVSGVATAAKVVLAIRAVIRERAAPGSGRDHPDDPAWPPGDYRRP